MIANDTTHHTKSNISIQTDQQLIKPIPHSQLYGSEMTSVKLFKPEKTA